MSMLIHAGVVLGIVALFTVYSFFSHSMSPIELLGNWKTKAVDYMNKKWLWLVTQNKGFLFGIVVGFFLCMTIWGFSGKALRGTLFTM